MLPERAKILKWFLKIFILTLFVVFAIRIFFIQSFRVSSSQMETALLKGDRVVVNKMAYGVRLPITVLSIPLTFGVYSDAIQLPYTRLFASEVGHNDVVVFNSPLELDKPLDRRSLYVSRCIAAPGDTMRVDAGNFSINGKNYIPSPNLLLALRCKKEAGDSLTQIMKSLNVAMRNFSEDSVAIYLTMNRYEFFLVNQNLPTSLKLEFDAKAVPSYSLQVPAKDAVVALTPQNVSLYAELIKQENEKENVKTEDSKIFINNEQLTTYTFKYNYYWFLSDNVDEATDSRMLGFISERNIIGRVSFIWGSYDAEKGFAWDRIFRFVD